MLAVISFYFFEKEVSLHKCNSALPLGFSISGTDFEVLIQIVLFEYRR